MNDFQFRLENLLEHRAEAENAAAGSLATAQSEAKDAERSYEKVIGARSEARDELLRLQDQGIGAGRLQSMRLMMERLEGAIQQAAQRLNAAREAVAAQREDYHRAHRERRALEELRQKRHSAWSRETARRDQRAMDEVATTRHRNAQQRLNQRESA